ncbi:MAG: Rieske (2Fe-2S) protein [Myxococcales bacterium]|nr:Rieske (2Fe-2S) protein [Myxococcales bacterium]
MMKPAYFAPLTAFDRDDQVVRFIAELGVRVLVARADGQWYACVARCPHGDVELGDQPLRGTNLTCGGHKYQFDLRTGMCTHTRHLRLTMLQALIDGDSIFVRFAPHASVAP